MLFCLKCGRFCSSLTSAVNEWRISEASVIGKLHFYSLLCTVLRRQGVEIPFETSAGREVIWSKVILVPESAGGTRVRKIGKCLTHHDTMIPGSAVLIQVLPAKQFRHRLLLHYFAFMRTILTLFPSADLNWDICQRGSQPANKRWIWILWGRMNLPCNCVLKGLSAWFWDCTSVKSKAAN